MQKDLKIGFLLGLGFVTCLAFWLSTSKSLTNQTRFSKTHNVESKQTVAEQQPRFEMNLPDSQSQHTFENQTPTNMRLKIHTVLKGETLSDISRIYYGSSNKWQKILNANRDKIKDFNKLRTGTRLTIPR